MSQPTINDGKRFLSYAIELARDNIKAGGRPFGAVVVSSMPLENKSEQNLYEQWAQRRD